MREKIYKSLTAVIALVLCIVFGTVLSVYMTPMEDLSLDLSLIPSSWPESASEASIPEEYDTKGWTVYTQEGSTVTELTPDGFGGYTGIELGQTFYYSRVMDEKLDSPTLQLGTADRTFSVWLDDVLIYTDRSQLDNRIGYLQLPMNGWDRSDPVIISLPVDYQGKTLTIAQSTPEYSETSSVKAYPASVMLYCGYAYESALISESFGTAIVAAAAFTVGVLLLIAFVLQQDWGLFALSLVAFSEMVSLLTDASFFWKYFDTSGNSPIAAISLISDGALLTFLATRAGRYRKVLWGEIAVYAVSIIVSVVLMLVYPHFSAGFSVAEFLAYRLPYWLAFVGLITVLIQGAVFWRKENRFYRIFTPLSVFCIVLYWIAVVFFTERGQAGMQILLTLQNGEISYVYHRTLPALVIAALLTATAETIQNEISRRVEKGLLEERRELVLESYENMRHQHEEVMMLRHDMVRHFQALRELSGEKKVKDYLDDLIGQNKKIRPVVQTGNEMLDIILNSKLGAAVDAGIKVEVIRATAPETLPLSDADLCSVVMNIMDNAVTAASGSGASQPFIQLDVHIKSDYLAFVCENSADINQIGKTRKKETVPKHGLGLKIIQNIARHYDGLINTEYGEDFFKIKVAIPLFQEKPIT